MRTEKLRWLPLALCLFCAAAHAQETKLEPDQSVVRELTGGAGKTWTKAEQEAGASALNHPNIITIHEIGIEGVAHYIATEFIDGRMAAF